MGFFDSTEYDYIWGITPRSKELILGPYVHGDNQVEFDRDKLVRSQVFVLKTKDKSRAAQEIKAKLLQQGRPADNVLQRMGHKIGFGNNQVQPQEKRAFEEENVNQELDDDEL